MPALSAYSPLDVLSPPGLDFVPPEPDSRGGDVAAQHYAQVRRNLAKGFVDEGLVLQPAVAPWFAAVEARYAQGFSLNWQPELQDVRAQDVAQTDPTNLGQIFARLGPTKDLAYLIGGLALALWATR